MMRRTINSCLLIACGIFSATNAPAQKPTPPLVIVQAANAPAPAAANSAAQDSSPFPTTLKALQEMKSANAETLKKQEAALQQLEEMQKAAEQLKIFAHRSGG